MAAPAVATITVGLAPEDRQLLLDLVERLNSDHTEKAVKEPTEPGLYRLHNGMVVELHPSGKWLSPNGSTNVLLYVAASKSFRRLVEVAQ